MKTHAMLSPRQKITLASDIRWHIFPYSSVVYVKYTLSSSEKICSTTVRPSVNISYGTGS